MKLKEKQNIKKLKEYIYKFYVSKIHEKVVIKSKVI